MGPTTRSSTRRSGQPQTEPPPKRAKVSQTKSRAKATSSKVNDTRKSSENDVEASTSLDEKDSNINVEPRRPPTANNIRHFNVPREKGNNHVICEYHYNNDTEAAPKEDTAPVTAKQLESTRLIFTHGAGGGLKALATRDFAVGFSSVSPIICFEGSMNLTSRVEGFNDVLRHHSQHGKANGSIDAQSIVYPALGGRSMGARAAMLRAEKERNACLSENKSDSASPLPTPRPLVFASYPLNPPGKQQSASDIAMRRGILLSIPEDTPVLLIVGSRDEFCSVEDLQDLVGEMKAQVWAIVVHGLDHGMNVVASALAALGQKVSKKDREEAAAALRRETGKYAALWLKQRADTRENNTAQSNSDRVELMWWDWHDKRVMWGEGKESL